MTLRKALALASERPRPESWPHCSSAGRLCPSHHLLWLVRFLSSLSWTLLPVCQLHESKDYVCLIPYYIYIQHPEQRIAHRHSTDTGAVSEWTDVSIWHTGWHTGAQQTCLAVLGWCSFHFPCMVWSTWFFPDLYPHHLPPSTMCPMGISHCCMPLRICTCCAQCLGHAPPFPYFR